MSPALSGAFNGTSNDQACTSWQKGSTGESTEGARLDVEFTSQLQQGWELRFCFWMEWAMKGLEREAGQFFDLLEKGKPLVEVAYV